MSNYFVEEWKNIVGYDGLYQISNLGNIRNKNKNLKPALSGKYLTIPLYKNGKQKTFLIHRLVAEHFLPNIECKKTVNHIDGNTTNNNVNNLEWNTYSENIKHSFNKLGRKATFLGKSTPISKKVICEETGEIYESCRKASISMGIHPMSISVATRLGIKCCGLTWRRI